MWPARKKPEISCHELQKTFHVHTSHSMLVIIVHLDKASCYSQKSTIINSVTQYDKKNIHLLQE